MCPIITAEELGGDYSQVPVPEGEFDLRVVSAKYAVSEKGNAGLTLGLRIEGEEDAPIVTTWLRAPIPNTPEYKRSMRDLKNVLKMFNFDMSRGFDMENDSAEVIGLTGRGFLTQEEDRRDGSMQNRLRLPRN